MRRSCCGEFVETSNWTSSIRIRRLCVHHIHMVSITCACLQRLGAESSTAPTWFGARSVSRFSRHGRIERSAERFSLSKQQARPVFLQIDCCSVGLKRFGPGCLWGSKACQLLMRSHRSHCRRIGLLPRLAVFSHSYSGGSGNLALGHLTM